MILEENDLRAALNNFRENTIYSEWEDDAFTRKSCILRRKMIDFLIRTKPASVDEWMDLLPQYLLNQTEPDQFDEYGYRIVEIIRRHRCGQFNAKPKQSPTMLYRLHVGLGEVAACRTAAALPAP